jgi:hypothetical protein
MSLEPFRGQGPARRTSIEPELSSFSAQRRVLGPPREAYLEDLSVRPSSSGQGHLVAYLEFRGADHSGQDFSNSGTVLTLRAQVDPRELPLLSGFMGRSFQIQKLEPPGIKDLEELRSKYQQLWEQYQFMVESLRELAQ